jgi:hypothetical protein
MKRLLCCWLILCWAIAVSAQRVPLVLDQTISLSDTGSLWDVMPHPGGYYVWAQASAPDARHTMIRWQRTNDQEHHVLNLAINAPTALTLFWRDNHTLYVAVATRYIFLFSGWPFDSTTVRLYRLTDGLPDSASWTWAARRVELGYPGWSTYDYHAIAAIPSPPPPAISNRFTWAIGYTYHTWDSYGWAYWDSVYCIANALIGKISPVYQLGTAAAGASWASNADSIFLVHTGIYSAQMVHPYGSYDGCDMRVNGNWIHEDGTSPGISIQNRHRSSYNACSVIPITAIFGSVRPLAYVFMSMEQENTFGVLRIASPDDPHWTTTGHYGMCLPIDAIRINDGEEFAAYDTTRHVFDVFSPHSGYRYGTSDTAFIPTNGGARIIGRYDSTSRRLVFRDGQQLKLYRFGQYLATGERNAMVPTSLVLSCYPNPFNPSTTISFSLERETNITLIIFDLTGRRVCTLAEGRWKAGAHDVRFDGAALPSGLYFARLQAGSFAKTQKLVMLK